MTTPLSPAQQARQHARHRDGRYAETRRTEGDLDLTTSTSDDRLPDPGISLGEPEPGCTYEGYRADDRASILGTLADGVRPQVVFGPNRPIAAQRLFSWLQGIAPTRADRLVAALGAGGERRIRAYDNGRKFLRSGYYDTGLDEQLPDTVDDRGHTAAQ